MKVKILNRKELTLILEMERVIQGVETAYRLKSKGETVVWPLVEHQFPERNAVTDIRSGGVFGDVNLHGLKMLNSYPNNAEQGLPTFTGLLQVYDSTNGMPLGILDASYITCMRTGAAGAIGAKALARKDSETLLVLGAGKQSIFQIAATLIQFPKLRNVWVADPLDVSNARALAGSLPERLETEFGIQRPEVKFQAAETLAQAVGESDIIITITPARSPVIKKEWVRPGTHFSCIGADMLGKEEIQETIFQGARVFADDIPQCVRVGELEIPIKKGVLNEKDICGEIGQVLSGEVRGRTSQEDITIFDATGLAILDLVTAGTAITLAEEKGMGMEVEL